LTTEARLARHHELVDKKYLEGLSPDESAELEQIDEALVEGDAAFYEPLLADLEERLAAAKRGGRS